MAAPNRSADLLLAGIALPILAAVLATVATSVGAIAALAAGSIPATGTIGYALFCVPPGEH